jgi:hypothetical protein
MKKLLSMLLAAAFIIANIHCGGSGGGGSVSGSGTSNVSVTLNMPQKTSGTDGSSFHSAQASSEIANINFQISAPDMTTIQRSISVEGKQTITESFLVPIGPRRSFSVETYNSDGLTISRGQAIVDLDGTPRTIAINLIPVEQPDIVPPVFYGLSSIDDVTETSLVLLWDPASDDKTTQNNIQYLIFISQTPNNQNFNAPSITVTGTTYANISGLNPNSTYYFVVKAKDEAGNQDGNTRELSVKTLQSVQYYTVNLSVSGSGGTIYPSTPQTVEYNKTTQFSITADAGYYASIEGCGGSMSEGANYNTIYTTGPITANCTVYVAFSQSTYTVTPQAGTGGTINPAVPQTVASGGTVSFNVYPNNSYALGSVIGCNGTGYWVYPYFSPALIALPSPYFHYTTGQIQGSCTVTANFIRLYTITASAGTNGTISPSGNVSVRQGDNKTYTISANSGCGISSVSVDNSVVAKYPATPYYYEFWNVTADNTISATFYCIY